MFEKIKEGKAEVYVPKEKKISKKLPVFYNSVMKFNRDVSVELLKQFSQLHLCDPLAGTGVRAIRFAKELKYKSITVNDLDENAVKLIKKNMKHNKVKFDVYNKDANLLLLESKGFDYIDIDPFGCPNFLLESSVKRISRKGIIAVTATDTSALSGTFPKACKRKYWAEPLHGPLMHEIGLRILIRKVQLIGAQYEKALLPIYSYSRDHYMRVFFVCEKRKKKVDLVLKEHGMFKEAGPMWLGKLWDKKIAKKIVIDDFTTTIMNESNVDVVGFYDIHNFCKKNKLKIPKMDVLIDRICKKYKVSRTHFSPYGLRSTISEKDLIKVIK